jgi:hypothetical protein
MSQVKFACYAPLVVARGSRFPLVRAAFCPVMLSLSRSIHAALLIREWLCGKRRCTQCAVTIPLPFSLSPSSPPSRLCGRSYSSSGRKWLPMQAVLVVSCAGKLKMIFRFVHIHTMCRRHPCH